MTRCLCKNSLNKQKIEAAINQAIENGPDLAMVTKALLIMVPDVIVDASMPAMIRTSGQM
jgi:isocitrate dehydrogenase